jgi:SAM-dependent methyltransferase
MPRHPEPPPGHPELPPGHPEPPPGQPQPAPTAAGFDATFSAVPASPGLRKVWQLAMPELPPEIEPFSFVSLGLLRHVARALNLAPGQTLVDLGCGRGGPGLWLARTANVSLTGVDFSPVAIEQATQRAALFGLAGRARFVIGDLTDTGLPGHSADAAVSVDAFHFAANPDAAATHARQLLRPGARLVRSGPRRPRRRHPARRPARRSPPPPPARRPLPPRRRHRVVVTAAGGQLPKPEVTTGKLPAAAAIGCASFGPVLGGTGRVRPEVGSQRHPDP